MKQINIMFLGASKRVSLIERFIKAAVELNVILNIYSCEKDIDFYPISKYAQILQGPNFNSDEFLIWLKSEVIKNKIDIVIPNMDSATVVLSKFVLKNESKKCWPVVSSSELCLILNNKSLANRFFIDNNLPVPENTPKKYPKIIKPIYGFGSKGIKILENEMESEEFFRKNPQNDYLVQDFIVGKETTVDFYISPLKGLLGKVFRDRLEVSDGEVMVCMTKNPSADEETIIGKIANIPGWCGCITVQYIKDNNNNIYLMEINPRFGGGATCSIEAGLDMPKYILSEYLRLSFSGPEFIKTLKMTRARRDFFCEL